ncbi:Asp/Glu racemase [Stackebrandtia nassauensis]|uniref:Asp/Glu racemase n=1 Tax=Stackebrandtia nassauensis (strain DSM 44728 / CIP 108903 / NRRL B-16338 / NBRC 102104 / LLR-40K-21) TaxID=446470 RepID=D3PWA2_STANL|nr:Asp/Glu racemase [Stackebrandtia nassauensis]ADD41259.1 Asp/Glu racemase [Stackebrandtia nassauensis DSM 44728]
MTANPRIALIHATPASITPAVTALAADFPTAEPWNLMDDKLLGDADAAGGLTSELRQRMRRLIDHAVADADGVLLTCSLYGPVAQATQAPIPVLAPDESAFDALVDRGYGSILVVASFDTALRDSMRRLTEFLTGRDAAAPVSGVVADGAFDAAKDGDYERLAVCLSHAVRGTDAEAVFFAQYSLAPAAERVAASAGVPVVTGPACAAVALRERLSGA